MIARPEIDLARRKPVIGIGIGDLSGNRTIEGLADRHNATDRGNSRANLLFGFAQVEGHALDRLTGPVVAWRIRQVWPRPGRDETDVHARIALAKEPRQATGAKIVSDTSPGLSGSSVLYC